MGWIRGLSLCKNAAKTLEKSQFCWPRIGPARVRLTHAQLLALVDGLYWKRVRPAAVKRPRSGG
ncbi:IS66 family insertion sequence element accessory protein TnpB [Mesorhizobium sp.]|uniref:IS66 family insertion sequence element accessory protein TnpB n=1 Tax=Mesorhizobium sp. TaxID=1871066 RepID=UPI00338F28D1